MLENWEDFKVKLQSATLQIAHIIWVACKPHGKGNANEKKNIYNIIYSFTVHRYEPLWKKEMKFLHQRNG